MADFTTQRDSPSTMKLRIPGVEVEDGKPGFTLSEGSPISLQAPPQVFRLSTAREADEAAATAPVIEVGPDTVVEVELEDGTRIWTTRQRLCAELIPPEKRREAADGVFIMPASLFRQGPSRGILGKLLIKTLSFFHINVAEGAARRIAATFENKTLDFDAGSASVLCRLEAKAEQCAPTPWDAGAHPLSPDSPTLLLIHGTASSTAGSFGELWTPAQGLRRRELLEPYNGNILALQHRTLTVSPVANAIAIASGLPAGARLHLISHSRGGMVGELLCRARVEGGRDPFTTEEIEIYEKQYKNAHPEELATLNRILREKRPRVERFARVACPARGTTLASERLDIYLSVLFNLLEKSPLGKIPALKLIFDLFGELIMAIAKERARPDVLPGIEAMVPGSTLVKILNHPGSRVEGELRVIAGDIEGENITSSLKTLLADPLFQDDNDLVVNTESMFGGAERLGGAAFSFHQGKDVCHFNYFKNEDSSANLVRTLTRAEAASPDGFNPYSVRATDSGAPVYQREAAGPPRPTVFLLPGIMGSHLSKGSDRIWLDPADLAFGGFGHIAIDQPGIQAESLIWMVYGALIRFLSRTHQVIPFAYDWRLSLAREAERLAGTVSEALREADKHRQPVSIIAHSMGGLLARALVAFHPEVWTAMKEHRDSRLIMLGTPNDGSHSITQALTGRDGTLRRLALLDLMNSVKDLTAIISRFPGVLELLPGHGSGDFFAAATWQDLAKGDADKDTWALPMKKDLIEALRVSGAIRQSPIDSDRMLYVAGHAPATPVDCAVIRDDDGRARLAFTATPRGDGRVPWEHGIPKGVRTWYLPVAHGDLPSHEESFPAFLELLRHGNTVQLAMTPPETRGIAESFPLPAEPDPLHPTFEELTRAAVGAARQRREPRRLRVRVSVAHGDLASASHAVMAGHYAGDSIVSAEDYLDRILEGRLRRRQRLELYPGALDTAEVFLANASAGKDAIVIGLGAVGELSPGGLTLAVSRGVRAYAFALSGKNDQGDEKIKGISTLLIGTGAGGFSVEDSVTAILKGVVHANHLIEEQGQGRMQRIEQVEFIELYLDRAIQATRALLRVKEDPGLARDLDIPAHPLLRTRQGGRKRASYREDPSWWQQLQILENSEGQLSFNLLTDRARAEVRVQADMRRLVDPFIAEMTRGTAVDNDLSCTLFEMLVPNDIKEYAPERRNLMLVLNEAAARYPWELLRDRPHGDGADGPNDPLSVQAGMVRRLQLEDFRTGVVMARANRALVVGNPPTSFADLPGAEAEAETVRRLLQEKGYAVTARIGKEASATAILKALHENEYRILHLAGHGALDHPYPDGGGKATGMVIGQNLFLEPAQVGQMRATPELVFINCCHLGKVEGASPSGGRLPHLAANLAAQFMRMGVKAVVAAGWAVDDTAAQAFAETFYQEMFAGASFGDAVRRARQRIFEHSPHVNTWGAYQCYGDPAFTLTAARTESGEKARATLFVAREEAVIEIDNIAAEAQTATAGERVPLGERLESIEGSMPYEWRLNGEVRGALGKAWGELGQFNRAIDHYQALIRDEQASYPLRGLEQLCNLEVRWASALAGRPETAASAGDLIRQAEERLSGLITAAGETTERLSLRASIAKRRALLSTGKERTAAIADMAERYRRASDYTETVRHLLEPYPLLNALTAQALLHLLEPATPLPATFEMDLTRTEQAIERNDKDTTTFWDRVIRWDCKLTAFLGRPDRADLAEAESIASGYLAERERGASPREFGSVREHVAFLERITRDAPDSAARPRLLAGLTRIREILE